MVDEWTRGYNDGKSGKKRDYSGKKGYDAGYEMGQKNRNKSKKKNRKFKKSYQQTSDFWKGYNDVRTYNITKSSKKKDKALRRAHKNYYNKNYKKGAKAGDKKYDYSKCKQCTEYYHNGKRYCHSKDPNACGGPYK